MKRSQAGARAQEAEPGARHRPLSLVPSQRPRRIEQNEAMIEESSMTEGFAAIGLHRPSRPENIGGVLRAADKFGVELVLLGRGTAAGAARTPDRNDASMATCPGGVRRPRLDVLPEQCVSVAVERVAEAEPLPEHGHPERAMYIFGPENGSLDETMLERCTHVVSIPTCRRGAEGSRRAVARRMSPKMEG